MDSLLVVNIPDTVQRIENEAFASCFFLEPWLATDFCWVGNQLSRGLGIEIRSICSKGDCATIRDYITRYSRGTQVM